MKVLVAMSGGVDSSVAAAMMVEEGHEVIGVTLKLWEGPDGSAPTAGCCTVSDSEDARRVAAQLDIPYYVLNYTSAFRSAVVDRFIDDYAHGWTPNPCVECNRTVKFDRLLAQAAELGCERLVTGHYARVIYSEGRYQLLRGVDVSKDQSYVLYMLGQQEMARVGFPVGGQTKAETRAIAESLALRTAGKPDSQDICFVGDRDYREFLADHAPETTSRGPIVDMDGSELARHDGVAGFTIGQRRKLGVALGEPAYVVGVDPSTATVTIGRRSDLAVPDCWLEDVTWTQDPIAQNGRCTFQYRAHGTPAPGAYESIDGLVHVIFDTPQMAIAPGQSGVLYNDDEVLGGGIVQRALPAHSVGQPH